MARAPERQGGEADQSGGANAREHLGGPDELALRQAQGERFLLSARAELVEARAGAIDASGRGHRRRDRVVVSARMQKPSFGRLGTSGSLHLGRGVQCALLVAVASTLPFAGTLGHGFALDDVSEVVRNDHVRSLADVPRLFTEGAWDGAGDTNPIYRPLTSATYALQHALGGPSPFGYHLGNVLLHAIASLLVLALGRRARPVSRGGDLRGGAVRGSPAPRGGGREHRRAKGRARDRPRHRRGPRARHGAAPGPRLVRPRDPRRRSGALREGVRRRRHRRRVRVDAPRRSPAVARSPCANRGALRRVRRRVRALPPGAEGGRRELRGPALDDPLRRESARARGPRDPGPHGDRRARPRPRPPRLPARALARLLLRRDPAHTVTARSRVPGLRRGPRGHRRGGGACGTRVAGPGVLRRLVRDRRVPRVEPAREGRDGVRRAAALPPERGVLPRDRRSSASAPPRRRRPAGAPPGSPRPRRPP